MKAKHVTMIGLISLLGVQGAYAVVAKPKGKDSVIASTTKTGGDPIRIDSSSNLVTKMTKGSDARIVNCKNEVDKYVPQSVLLNRVLDPGAIEISFDEKEKSVRVHLPQLITTCFKPKAQLTTSNNTIYLTIVNEFDLKEFTGNNSDEKYDSCLRKEGILVGEGDSVEIDFEAAHKKNQLDTLDLIGPVEKFDPKKKLDIVYGSPEFLKYPAPFGKRSYNSCLNFEEMAEGGLALVTDKNAKLNEFLEACRGTDLTTLETAIREVESSTGNFPGVAQVLKEAYEKLADDRVVQLKKKLSELGPNVRTGKDREVVKGEAAEYIKVLRELKKLDIDRKIAKIKELSKALQTAGKEKKQEIMSQIAELNKGITEYARKSEYVSESLVKNLEKHALTSQADEVGRFRLTSVKYGQLGRKKDEKAIEKEIDQEMTAYTEHLEVVEKRYNASQGYETYSDEFATRSQSLSADKQEYWESAMQEYKDGASACQQSWFSVKNPVRCKQWQSSLPQWQKRYQENMKDYDYEIGRQQGLYMQFKQLEFEAQRKEAQEFGDDERSPLGMRRSMYRRFPSGSTDDSYGFGRSPAMSPFDQSFMGQGQPMMGPQQMGQQQMPQVYMPQQQQQMMGPYFGGQNPYMMQGQMPMMPYQR